VILMSRLGARCTQDVTWHEDRWDDPESRFLAFTLHDRCVAPARHPVPALGRLLLA
jgi:hypothetical protein